MALVVDSPPNNFKHFCKICKKGFLCGRALGGHMRAHGIGEDAFNVDDEDEDDPASDWDEDKQLPPGQGNKRMYALRTNSNRLRSCRACENCGKEFMSWKSFLEHGKCSSEDAESLNMSSPSSDYEDASERRGGWSKRKRSFKNDKVDNFGPLSEEEDLANCLMMLSNAIVEEPHTFTYSGKDDLIAPLVAVRPPPPQLDKAKLVANNNTRGMFECKACKKVFNSHQALGGHRASHKKVKGCFAAKLDHISNHQSSLDNQDEFHRTPKSISDQLDQVRPSSSSNLFISKRKSKVHECSICHRVFSSGQALGGHKRCHWITPNSADDSSFHARFQQLREHHNAGLQAQESHIFSQTNKALDLNIPAMNHDDPLCLNKDSKNVLSLKVSTEFFLQSWGGVANSSEKHQDHQQRLYREHDVDRVINEEDNREDANNNTNNNSFESLQNLEDEADSKAKLAKLSELRDMNTTDGASPWLQVGIGSTNGAEREP